jgi:hypothetical protein
MVLLSYRPVMYWPAEVWRDREIEREREREILERGRVTGGKAGHAVVGELAGGAVTEREREREREH